MGDSWAAYEYMAWITEKHHAFRAANNLPDVGEYNEAERAAFLEFIGYEKEGKANGRG